MIEIVNIKMKKISTIIIIILLALSTLFILMPKDYLGTALKKIVSWTFETYNKAERWNSYEKDIVGIVDEKLLIKDKGIIAYTNKLVYGADEEIQLNLIGTDKVNIKVYQIDRDGREIDIYNLSKDINISSLAVFSSFEGIISPTEIIRLESKNLGSGWFGIQIKNTKEDIVNIPIFIDPDQINKKIVYVESTDTLMAYNYAYEVYKIPNHYKKTITNSASALVPHNMPIIYNQVGLNKSKEINCEDHLINSDMVHKVNLNKLGFDFQSISDELLDDKNTLNNVDILIFGSHNEYWTKSKAKNVINFINNGGKILLLGANHAWRQVYRQKDRTWLHGHGLMKDPIFNELVKNYIGTYYTPSDYQTYAGIKILDSKAMMKYFSIDVEKNFVIGNGTRFDHCNKKILGISGHETDKLTNISEGFIHLAKGQNSSSSAYTLAKITHLNKEQNKSLGADVIYKSFPSGGEVLNFSSLSLWHNKDPIINKMIENFINNSN